MRRWICLTVMPLLAIALIATAMGGNASGRATSTVMVDDDFFAPDTLKVKQGKTVRFEWVGEGEHNVAKGRGPGPDFMSETSDETGFVYERKFRKAGKYVLICTFHSEMQMDLNVKKKRKRR